MSSFSSHNSSIFISFFLSFLPNNFSLIVAIDVPAEKVDLVDELAGKVEELETKLNEEIERGVSFAKALVESRKKEIAGEVCEGLIATQVEKSAVGFCTF